jgi:NAD(P)H-hydrate epimerase
MKVVTPSQMKEIDEFAIQSIGIPGVVLMENAALGIVNEIVGDFGDIKGKAICLFAGKGNNGGDAFAVARHLYNKGAQVTVLITADKREIAGDAAINLGILDKMGITMMGIADDPSLEAATGLIGKVDLIVDGILGTGLKGEIKGIIREVLDFINGEKIPVLAIDIPSGVNGETGEIHGVCIKAYKTVTFALPKPGHFLHPGCGFIGKLVVSDIGIPEIAVQNSDIKNYVIDEERVKKLIPIRYPESNKGDCGKLLIITGSTGMTGAGCLTGGAALRSGAGLVYMAVPSSLVPIYESNLIESVTISLEDEKMGCLSKKAIPEILEQIEKLDAVAIGPGLSLKGDVIDVVARVIENSLKPLVIDADGINAVAKDVSVLNRKKAQIVFTPHPGEMARLLGVSIKEVQSDRIKIARDFSRKWDVVTVLKGSRTIVASPDGRVYININGNSGMSTGGTGDVLTGIITSLIGQGLNPVDAAVAGVYLHGLSGDSAAGVKGEHGIVAGDLVQELPGIIKKLISTGR